MFTKTFYNPPPDPGRDPTGFGVVIMQTGHYFFGKVKVKMFSGWLGELSLPCHMMLLKTGNTSHTVVK